VHNEQLHSSFPSPDVTGIKSRMITGTVRHRHEPGSDMSEHSNLNWGSVKGENFLTRRKIFVIFGRRTMLYGNV